MSNGSNRGRRTPYSRIQGAYGEIVRVIKAEFGYDSDIDEANFADTPKRCAKALHEMVWPWEKIEAELKKCVEVRFPTGGVGSIVDQHDIIVSLLCPHHLMPAIVRVSACYLPGNASAEGEVPEGRVIGISKIARVAKILSHRPVLQEEYSRDLADMLCNKGVDEIGYKRGEDLRELPMLPSAGSAVRTEALHTCMACRGVEAPTAVTGTTDLRGVMFNNSVEFYRMIELSRSRKLFGA